MSPFSSALPPPAARTKTSWLLGAVSVAAGALWTWGLVEFLGRSGLLRRGGLPDSPAALLFFLIWLLLGLPGLALLILGVRFTWRPGLPGLQRILALLSFAAGVCLTSVLIPVCRSMVPAGTALSVSVFMATLLILPAHVLALTRCAALTGLARLNPWRAAGGAWIHFLAAQVWYALFTYPGWWTVSESTQAAPNPGTGILFLFSGIFLPILAAWFLASLADRWLRRKAGTWDLRHPGTDYPEPGGR